MTPTMQPEIRAVAPTEKGWWQTMQYKEPGMTVGFEGVNGVPESRAIETSVYAIDTTESRDQSDGLYLVAAGCLVDVEKLATQFEETHASGGTPDGLSMDELFARGSVLPLSQRSHFRLPPQVVGRSITLSKDGQAIKPAGAEKTVQNIEADLRIYGVHSAEGAARFAAGLSIEATGLSVESGMVTSRARLDGSPLTRAAKRLNYALTPAAIQGQMSRPMNKDEVIDATRAYLAGKLAA